MYKLIDSNDLILNIKKNNNVSQNFNIKYFTHPYHHICIDNFLTQESYDKIIKSFPSWISRSKPYKDQPGATSNYNAIISGITVEDWKESGMDLFVSEDMKSFLSNIFNIKTNKYVSSAAHFHKAPSIDGWSHRDMDLCSFMPSDNDEITSPKCHYTEDSVHKQPNTIKSVRAVVFLYYLNHPENLIGCNGGETAMYDDYNNIIKKAKPLNNSLFAFEITPHSLHSYIGADFDRSCIVQWYHSDPAYYIHRHLKEIKKFYKKNHDYLERWSVMPHDQYWPIENDPDYFKYFGRPIKDIL